MDVSAKLIELKPGTEQRVREWAAFLSRHREEANETLRSEGVDIESWFEVTLDDKRYLLCYIRAESIKQAEAVAGRSKSAVDAYHEQFKVDNLGARSRRGRTPADRPRGRLTMRWVRSPDRVMARRRCPRLGDLRPCWRPVLRRCRGPCRSDQCDNGRCSGRHGLHRQSRGNRLLHRTSWHWCWPGRAHCE